MTLPRSIKYSSGYEGEPLCRVELLGERGGVAREMMEIWKPYIREYVRVAAALAPQRDAAVLARVHEWIENEEVWDLEYDPSASREVLQALILAPGGSSVSAARDRFVPPDQSVFAGDFRAFLEAGMLKGGRVKFSML